MRFTCVCKAWNHLINSSRFMSMHLHHATKDSYRNCNKVILKSVSNSFQSLDYEASTAKVEQLHFPLKPSSGCLTVLGSCNGLLCIDIDDGGIVLWNPSIRKYKEIPLSSREFSGSYGFGYDSTIDDYKVVKVHCNNRNVTDQQVEIYSLKSNSWTTVENRPPPIWIPTTFKAGTLVTGAFYWFVFLPAPISDGKYPKIFRFDLRDDTWILIQPPHDVHIDCLDLNLRDFGGRLCLFKTDHHAYRITMWTLKENNYEKSWIKLRTIPRGEEMPSRGYLVPVCSKKNGEILLKTKRFDVLEKVKGNPFMWKSSAYTLQKKKGDLENLRTAASTLGPKRLYTQRV